jgi:hypothetical protein
MKKGETRPGPEPAVFLQVLSIEPLEWIEMLDFAGEPRGVSRGIEQRDGRNAGTARENGLPCG